MKRALQGDLDWIVMKALEKDRTRRYETANGFAADILRHLAHEPVRGRPAEPGLPAAEVRAEAPRRGDRGEPGAAGAAGRAGRRGGGADGGQRPAGRVAEERDERERGPERSQRPSSAESRAAVQARYELAADAIKTFHTGVSEDFLLKEEKFKDLRDRLLKSASDFYGKLGALLGKETDLASRRALAQANFELADLTDKVGRKEDALAAHRQVLAAREALAAEPGADVETKVDVGRSLTAVAGLLSAAGKTDEAEATYRKAETLLADLARSSPSTRPRGPRWRTAGRGWGGFDPTPARSPTRWWRTAWRGPIRRRWPPPPAHRRRPGVTWRTRSIAPPCCCTTRASSRRRRPSTARRWRSGRSWPTTTPPSPNSAPTWRAATTTSASC